MNESRRSLDHGQLVMMLRNSLRLSLDLTRVSLHSRLRELLHLDETSLFIIFLLRETTLLLEILNLGHFMWLKSRHTSELLLPTISAKLFKLLDLIDFRRSVVN